MAKTEEKPWYSEPCEERPCSACKYCHYDSFHDELWCSHEPPPDGLGSNLLIDNWGTCEYWEKCPYS